jgi:ADP-L-glycero-D-manno-heptose 6-epimerase
MGEQKRYMMRDTIVITGAAGFIGWNLTQYLLKFTTCDLHLIESEACAPAALRRLRRLVNIPRVKITFIDPEKNLEQAISDATIQHSGKNYIGLVHLGATCSTRAVETPALWRNNVEFSIALINFYEKHCPVLFASTAAIYGGTFGTADKYHEFMQIDPMRLSPYAWTKYAVEQAVAKPARNYVLALRFFNVYGEHEEHKGNMISFPGMVWRRLEETSEVVVYDSSNLFPDQPNARDFVHVEDCCSLMLNLLRTEGLMSRVMPLTDARFAVLNVGTGEAVPLETVAQTVAAEYSSRTEREVNVIKSFMPSTWRDTYQPYTCADTSILQRTKIKFRSFEEGMESFRWAGSPAVVTENK